MREHDNIGKTTLIRHETRRPVSSWLIAQTALELSRLPDGTIDKDAFAANCRLSLAVLTSIEQQLADASCSKS